MVDLVTLDEAPPGKQVTFIGKALSVFWSTQKQHMEVVNNLEFQLTKPKTNRLS